MDDVEADERYHPKPYHHSSSNRRTIHVRNNPYSRPPPPPNRYDPEDDDDLDEESYGQDVVVVEQQYQHHPNHRSFDGGENGWEWHPKKRKLRNLEPGSGYEFAPRVKMPGREEWTEHAVFVLLEVWGDRFLQLGRKSLRSEDWGDVAAKVSEGCKMERSEKQCRSMLDMLKRKYKKEKAKIDEGGGSSKWGYFKKMEMLMASSTRQECGLACGVDNGEFVFMNTRVYLEKSNGVDEMRDSPGESETDDDENENVSDQNGFGGFGGGGGGSGGLGGSSYRVLADSIQKFGEIYESIESSKRQQMMELEKMRREFNMEMEVQKKQILERAQAEIAKIQEADDEDEDDDDSDGSAEDISE
ncbi:trihelix transcription factor ENAP1 [Argentina anserina]|uniref:trihelix transcription factor ENAP1 n=1 Tax=Argentina anserina TaxID=57926 RepID=UPI002176814C|nr:trihelix transcription factor ENAP1 [Potentilla anserina]XP_050388029.1 trihelix transcription factor ENAP1 [Potentilla anserina]